MLSKTGADVSNLFNANTGHSSAHSAAQMNIKVCLLLIIVITIVHLKALHEKQISTPLFLFLISLNSIAQYNDRQLIINTTGYGLDKDASNGIAPGQWAYIQKFANLTYNGQDASVTAVRFHVTWRQYEPTLGNYQRTKLFRPSRPSLH